TGDVYAGGRRVNCTVAGCSLPSGTNNNADFVFESYMEAGFEASGTFTSTTRDANPAPGSGANWGTLTWNATTPANTQLQLQVAASNSPYGPFSFVGPDGTPATFYTGGNGSLAQFDSNRYLQYRAYLSSSDATATPALNDATVCFTDGAGGPAAD